MRRLSMYYLDLLLLLSAVLGTIVTNFGTHKHGTIYMIIRLKLFIILLEEYKIRMNTTSKMMVSGILAILVVAISSGGYSINQVSGQGGAEDEAASQRALQIQDCKQLQARMANDPAAAAQFQSKDCAGLLAGTS